MATFGDNLVAPMLTLLIGALLGLASSWFVANMKQKQTISLRLLDQYFEVRKDIVDTLVGLSNLSIYTPLSAKQRDDYRKAISKMIFKHYDFLPREVVDSLHLLYATLSDRRGRLYTLRGNAILPMERDEGVTFARASSSMYLNATILARAALDSSQPSIRCNQAVQLHARDVLQTLNEYASVGVLPITKGLRSLIRSKSARSTDIVRA